eukprot:m.199728 g.199728  ORF g.199728 m.199728 type:complete len:140 (-) comp18395_c0_seq7:792-1211(-)
MATTGLPLLQELFGSDSETEREPGVECLGVAKRKRARRRSPRTSEHATTETICGTRPCRDGVCAYNAVLLPVDGVPGLQRCPLFLSPLQQSALLQQLDATYFEHAGPEKNQRCCFAGHGNGQAPRLGRGLESSDASKAA